MRESVLKTAPRISDQVATEISTTEVSPFQKRLEWLRSPLWLCLLLALLVRIWLIWHTRGFVDADEALVGIQAQHILQGERPAYYYGQPYMGSLEAYLIAGAFALSGSSVWTLRIVPLLLSLALVWFTWHLAGELTIGTKLSQSARRWCMTVAGLLAAFPPLYDLVIEMRAWGGHIEIYLLMLGLLFSTLRLTRRWEQGASPRELALRWVGIGGIIGVGMWIYPLLISAILAMMVWISVFFIRRMLIRIRAHGTFFSPEARNDLSRLGLAAFAVPACLIGFAPGLYWGMQNNWSNVLYLLAPGSDGGNDPNFLQHSNRFMVVLGTAQLYGRCLVPEIFGGSLPSQSLTQSSVYTFWILTALGVANLVGTTILFVASFHPRVTQQHPLFTLRRLATLPLLFAGCTIFIFCFSSTVGSSIFEPCTRDGVGRYAAPILLTLPLTGAALFAVAYQALQNRVHSRSLPPLRKDAITLRPSTKTGSLLLIPLLLYTGLISHSYVQSHPGYVFQSFTCLHAPFDNQAIIDYMQREGITHAWSTITVGNSIMFKTGEKIIVSDPRIITNDALNRLPQNVTAVAQAERASVIDMVPRSDGYPETLQRLDQAGIPYKVARFPTEPGNIDVLVITPTDQTLTPGEASSYGAWEMRC